MNPVILITSDDGYNAMFQTPHTILDREYARAVTKAGGIPAATFDLNCANEYCELADGLILTGSKSNIHPGLYGKFLPEDARQKGWQMNEMRDDIDLLLFHAFYKAGKPIFGIDRGLHIINIALGGDLLLEQAGHHDTVHPVLSEKGTFIEEIYGEKAEVNSYHRQGVGTVSQELRTAAKTADGLVEALYCPDKPVLGVQWHPEINPTQKDDELFSYFISLCKGGAR